MELRREEKKISLSIVISADCIQIYIFTAISKSIFNVKGVLDKQNIIPNQQQTHKLSLEHTSKLKMHSKHTTKSLNKVCIYIFTVHKSDVCLLVDGRW